MGNDNYSKLNGLYDFLTYEEVENTFADLNIKLLKGKHIQQATDQKEYILLKQKEYFDRFQIFYERLYGLLLHERQTDAVERYFYLDYSDGGRGAMAPQERHIVLTELQTLFGLMLMNMYYEKFFERVKKVSWSDIKDLILHSDRQESYKLVFFGQVREGNNYSDPEWGRLKNNFKSMVRRFNDLGWITATIGDEFNFTINTSIHRFEDLYKDELNNPDELFKRLLNRGREFENEDGEELS